jgi:hypothetical protein
LLSRASIGKNKLPISSNQGLSESRNKAKVGHMMMLELNSKEIAQFIGGWLDETLVQ